MAQAKNIKRVLESAEAKALTAKVILKNGECYIKLLGRYAGQMNSLSLDIICWATEAQTANGGETLKQEKAGGYGYDKLAACMEGNEHLFGIESGAFSKRGWQYVIAEAGFVIVDVL